MNNLFLNRGIRWLLIGIPLLLPAAHIKTAVFGFPLYLIELPVIFAAVLFFFGAARQRTFGYVAIDRWIVLGAVLFFFGAALSFSANPFSLTGLGQLKTWFFFPLFAAFLVVQAGRDEASRERFLAAWFFAILIVALGSAWFLLQGMLTYDGRLQARYASPNFLALFIAPGILLAAYFLQRKAAIRKRKIFFGASLALFVIITFFTHSYGAWLAVLIALAIMPVSERFSRKSGKNVLVSAALLVIAAGALISFEQGTEKWQSLASLDERSSFSSRLQIWRASGKMLSERPFFGIGIGRFQEEYLTHQKYFPPYLEWAVPQPHNFFLAVWLQAGLVGLIGFLMLITRLMLLSWSAYKDAFSESDKRMTILLFSILIFFLIYGLTDTPYFKSDLAFMFWLLAALIASRKH